MCAGVGGRRPSPPQRASTSCAPPPPEGEGDGRGKGRGLREEAPGEKDQAADRPGAEQARAPTRRRRGRRSTAPRNGPRAAEGGMAGRAPRVGAGPAGGRQRLPRPPRSGPRAAPPGARAGDSGPPPTAGAAHAPHLVRPGADPRRGRARGKRGTERGPGRREPPQGGPADAAPRRPAARSTIPKGWCSGAKGKRPGHGLDASGKDDSLAESTPCRLIVPRRRRCCQAPGGGGPLLDIRTLFRQRGALTGHCLGLPRPGRDDVPFPSAS